MSLNWNIEYPSFRVSATLNITLQEIEEKAPVLQRQKEDYEMALKTIENLTSKFDAALEVCQKFLLV